MRQSRILEMEQRVTNGTTYILPLLATYASPRNAYVSTL